MITGFGRNIKAPWFCVGDFNDFLSISEKSGGNPCVMRRILNFQNFAANCDLLDIGSKGPRFTWCNQRIEEDCIMERIDRAMGNGAFRDKFPKALSLILESVASYHHFQWVSFCYQHQNLPPSFKYEINWAYHPEFKGVVKRSWYFEDPHAAFIVPQFHHCTKRCSKALSIWIKGAFPNNRTSINGLLNQIAKIKSSSFT